MTVRANHYRLSVPKATYYQFSVLIHPVVPMVKKRRMIMQKMQERFPLFRTIALAYDGDGMIYTATPLPEEMMGPTGATFSFPMETRGTGAAPRPQRGPEKPPPKPFEFTVTLRPARMLSVAPPVTDEERTGVGGRRGEEGGHARVLTLDVVQALDVVLLQHAYHQLQGFKSRFFSPNFGRPVPIPLGCEAWRGFHQSVRHTQAGVVLNVDTVATTMVAPLPLVQFMAQTLGKPNEATLERGLSPYERMKVAARIKNLKVGVTYGSTRVYKIRGIERVTPGEATFECDGQWITVQYYFENIKHIKLRFPRLPCIQVGPEERNQLFPPEVLHIRPGQRNLVRLNDAQIKKMMEAQVTRSAPQDRFRELSRMMAHCRLGTDEPFMQSFSLGVNLEPVTARARVLDPPPLYYEDAQVAPAGGQWNMVNRRLLKGATINKWTALNLDKNFHERDFHGFLQGLVEMCVKMGMLMGPPVVPPVADGKITAAEACVRQVVERARTAIPAEFLRRGEPVPTWINLELLVIVLDEKRSTEYAMIKRVCETELGVVTQVVTADKIKDKMARKGMAQYLANVALKMNVKAGGCNVALFPPGPLRPNPPGPSLLAQEPTIIFGADVVHPTGFAPGVPSVAAVVASMDWPHVTRYRAAMGKQDARKEVIEGLYTLAKGDDGVEKHEGFVYDHLLKFYAYSGLRPSRIIFYRDGVSEGEFRAVLVKELTAIRAACKALPPQGEYCPRVTFIVARKRHHTRFCPKDPSNPSQTCAGRSGNVKPGLVVDRDVCHPVEHDFYLTAHVGLQGTAKPTHYTILWDENGFGADDIQELTNALCYTFARCTRSVSIVPPVYYAHLAAYRARVYMDKEESYSDAGSSRSGSGETQPAVQLPPVKQNLQEVMFYC
eukprot:jgi/Mesvir1/19679/Mv09951-RA.1